MYKRQAPVRPSFPSTLGADILRDVSNVGVYGAGFTGVFLGGKLKPVTEMDRKSLEGIRFDAGISYAQRDISIPLERTADDTKLGVSYVQLQAQMQKYRLKFDVPTVKIQIPKVPHVPRVPFGLLPDTPPRWKKKKGGFDLLGLGYRGRRWRVPSMKDLLSVKGW